MRKTRLTVRQLRALAIIDEFAGRRGAGPTMRELADGLGISAKSVAMRHVAALARKGFVTMERKGERMRLAARTLRVTDKGHRLLTRWEQFHSSGRLRGERELVLSADEWELAQKMGLSVRRFWVRTEGDLTVLTFDKSTGRDGWVLKFLSVS